jgi:hypothetical protein
VHPAASQADPYESDVNRRSVLRGAYANQSMLSERVQLIVRRTAYHFLGMKKHAAAFEELRL